MVGVGVGVELWGKLIVHGGLVVRTLPPELACCADVGPVGGEVNICPTTITTDVTISSAATANPTISPVRRPLPPVELPTGDGYVPPVGG